MFPILQAVVAVAGFLWWRDEQQREHRVRRQRELSPAALDEITTFRKSSPAAPAVRCFRPDVAKAIANAMRQFGCEVVRTPEGKEVEGCYFLRRRERGAGDAHDAAKAAIASGLVVLGTFSCADLADPATDALIYFVRPDAVGRMAGGRHPYAVLGEPTPAALPIAAPVVRATAETPAPDPAPAPESEPAPSSSSEPQAPAKEQRPKEKKKKSADAPQTAAAETAASET